MAMIVLVGETSMEDVNLLKSTLSSLKKSSFFYLAYVETGKNNLIEILGIVNNLHWKH